MSFIKQLLCRHHEYMKEDGSDWYQYERVPVEVSEFRETGYHIYTCRKCGHRSEGTYGINKGSTESAALLERVLREMGLYESYYVNDQYGSWYYCEFIPELAATYKEDGEEVAIAFIKQCFGT